MARYDLIGQELIGRCATCKAQGILKMHGTGVDARYTVDPEDRALCMEGENECNTALKRSRWDAIGDWYLHQVLE